ncbi:MAG: AtpZ/AtpI family protein [Bacteroidetes bacterium]|nr:MAG: AtpZ/AtpI family protein [Bacteroidota bacterium]
MGKPKLFYDLLKYSSLGLEMGAAVVIGLLMGIYLDKRFETYPWLTLLFMCFGFVAATKALIKALKKGIFLEEEGEE